MDKVLTFHVFRYHLSPITSGTSQIEMFEKYELTAEEIRARKNEFFNDVLEGLTDYSDIGNPLKLEHHENGFFFIKLAQKKSAILTKDFTNQEVENEPFVYILINNDSNVQKIAISDNTEAFSHPRVVKNILKKLFSSRLRAYGLNIEIEEMFKAEDFWKVVSKHKHEIKEIDFKYIKPNLANISSALPEDFRKFTDRVNSHESHIKIKAPENGVLENIEKTNSDINGLVEYTSEGAGDVKLKLKNIKKKYSTRENPVTTKIGEATIEGPAEQVVKVYQTIISE